MKTSATWKGLTQEPLNLAGAEHHQLVFGAEFVHAKDCDDVLEILIALQNLLHPAGDIVMLFTDHFRRE